MPVTKRCSAQQCWCQQHARTHESANAPLTSTHLALLPSRPLRRFVVTAHGSPPRTCTRATQSATPGCAADAALALALTPTPRITLAPPAGALVLGTLRGAGPAAAAPARDRGVTQRLWRRGGVQRASGRRRRSRGGGGNGCNDSAVRVQRAAGAHAPAYVCRCVGKRAAGSDACPRGRAAHESTGSARRLPPHCAAAVPRVALRRWAPERVRLRGAHSHTARAVRVLAVRRAEPGPRLHTTRSRLCSQGHPEGLARHMLLISVLLDDAAPLRGAGRRFASLPLHVCACS
jgi:hypothetical protein